MYDLIATFPLQFIYFSMNQLLVSLVLVFLFFLLISISLSFHRISMCLFVWAVCVCVCVSRREADNQVSYSIISLNPELTNSARLAVWPAPGILLFLLPPELGYRFQFCGCWESELGSSCLRSKHFYWLSHLLSPSCNSCVISTSVWFYIL